MWAIFKREFKALYQSVIGWLFIAVTLGVFGLYFYVYNLVYGYAQLSTTLSAITFILLITVPILTMRILAEERRSKTDQLILTAPVSVGKVVLGKYLALAATFTIPVAVMCATPLLLRRFGDIPYGECYVAILGYWLFGLTCIAIGTFISSLTESQVIAAVLSFGALFLGYMMSGITGMISSSGNVLTKILSCYDLTSRMDDFFSGFLDVQAVIYYVSMIALFLFLSVQSIQKRRWSMSSKKIATGVFSTGFIAIALAAVVVVNLIGGQLPETIRAVDMTSQKLYSITDETKTVLGGLDEDVTVYVLANEKSQDATVGKTLERYANYSKHIKVVYKDPAVSPSFYTSYTDGSVTKNSLIVEGSKRSKVIDYYDLYETQVDYSTYSSKVTGYDAEGQLTSAITYVTSQDTPVVYQVTGHDEQSLAGTFSDAVSKQNITLESLNLMETDEIPADAAGLIINAPAKDLSSDDVDKVLSYLEKGGKALIVTGYTGTEMPNFERLLAAYEVSIADGIVMETNRTAYYQAPYFLMPKASYDTVTANVSGSYIFVPYAQGLLYPKDDGAEDGTADTSRDPESTSQETGDAVQETKGNTSVTYKELLATTSSSYCKVNVANMETYEKEAGDIDGPFALGLHVSKALADESNGAESQEGADSQSNKNLTAELYIFSSTSIFTDEASQMAYGNNAAMFGGVLSEFAGDEVSSVVPVKSYETAQLVITQANIVFGGLALAILVPVVLLVLGIVVWVRRRRR